MNALPMRPIRRGPRWRRLIGFIRHRRLYPALEIGTALAALGIGVATWATISRTAKPTAELLPPALVALLLIANLVPAMALLVLIARRFAVRRAAGTAIGGGGRLHVQLVAIFSVLAAVPTLLVVIFASLLFQYGVEFWFSERARVVLVNADRVAQTYVAEHRQRISDETVAMATDIRNALGQMTIEDPRFSSGFATQIAYRVLTEAAIVQVGPAGPAHLLAGSLVDKRPLDRRVSPAAVAAFRGKPITSIASGDRVEAVMILDPGSRTYLYTSRFLDPAVLKQAQRVTSALGEYRSLLDRSRTLQLRFNAALFLVSLLIVALAIWIALALADRLVRPLGELAGAARRVAGGDLSVRVGGRRRQDEVGTLATAFNRMTRRLEEQTGALVSANRQSESRRALIEAVLSGVTAGVISLDAGRQVRIINSSATELIGHGGEGDRLADIAPELDDWLASGEREAVVQVALGGEHRTWAVKRVRAEDGDVLTFDDITQQLTDQRRAAWADVARRIAHEIKNPLTPIQLAAERLQRRYGKEIESDPATFERLTGTIVRQVGDLRRMVDEFSSFARMPKPVFRPEAIAEIARQQLFLHEVANPAIRFVLDAPEPAPEMVCDRRQIGQALLNLVKNAVEAIDTKHGGAGGAVTLRIETEGDRLTLTVSDDGAGLPPDRERLTEPYMTTRAKGTGLGLAIVKKIVEEHFGTIGFADRPGGGAVVRLCFDLAVLARLAEPDDRELEPAGDERQEPLRMKSS